MNYERTERAVFLQGQGQSEEAEALLREQISEFPGDALALYSLAVIEYNSGKGNASLQHLQEALALWPTFEQAIKAKELVERAIKSQHAKAAPQEAFEPRILAALSLHHAGQLNEAQHAFEALFTDYPESFPVIYSLAVLASQLGQPLKAIELADRALERAESSEHQSLAHSVRGTLRMGLGLFDDALTDFDHAIELKPDNAQASNNKASLLQTLHRDYEAMQCLAHAHEHNPQDSSILSNLGIALTIVKQHAAAVPIFDRLLACDSRYELAEGYRFFAKLHACDWSQYDEHRAAITTGIREGHMVVNPLAFMAMSDHPGDHLQCARIFANRRYPVRDEPIWHGEHYRHRRLRVGYLSPDFREHAVGTIMAGVIEQHNPIRIETFAFSLGADDGSTLRKRFKVAFEHFIDCKDKFAVEIASLIRAAEIDILVDLAGYTGGSKADIFAMRPAPVQVNYLGFAGTMGANFMDCIIADDAVIPRTSERFYTEKVFRLPSSYLPLDDTIIPSADSGTRADHGLPERGIVFCSFNHDYKINPSLWDVWMDLLRDFPGSVLWLIKLNQDSEANLRKEALRRDIDPNRIIFAERLPSVEAYLARYDHVDVYLDTFPYNAHSTATDLARMGVPVVTAVGRSFASRVCAGVMSGYGSILSNDPVPYQEAIQSATDTGRNTTDRDHEAHVLAQYKDRARQFAQSAHDTQHLRIQTKNRLAVTSGSRRGNVKALSGLTAKHSRSLEDLYQQMYSMRLSNEL